MQDTFHLRSPAEQVAEFLRGQIARGVWQTHIPGTPTLMKALGVDHRVVISAFDLLEKEGVLVSEGVGKRRRINLGKVRMLPVLKFQLLTYEESDRQLFYLVDLQHRLMEAGHTCSFSSVTLASSGSHLDKVKRYVERNKVDGWIVFAGSKHMLEWIASRQMPVFALAGRMTGCPIAGCRPDKQPALRAAVRRLVELGHRRIVLLVREGRRKPKPGLMEQAFLEELEAHGIKTGSYNLPDWNDNMHAFHHCLDSLFHHTPPTAVIVDEIQLFTATQQHLAHRGILAPQDVSLICTDPNPAFAWCQPTIAYIDWDATLLVKKTLKWALNVARGHDDRRQDTTPTHFVEGGTVGPVPLKTKT